MSNFIRINKSQWKRTPYFEHYLNQVRCSYSMTVNINITNLKYRADRAGLKLYPLLIHALTTLVNRHEEFRTSFNSHNELGIWESMHPSYTIFNKENKNFSSIWTKYDPDVFAFVREYNADVQVYSQSKELLPKPNGTENVFPISAIPWATFTSFNLNIYGDGSFLLPIFTWGKSFADTATEELLIPLSIHVHHAVCDGYHLSRFISELQERVDNMLE